MGKQLFRIISILVLLSMLVLPVSAKLPAADANKPAASAIPGGDGAIRYSADTPESQSPKVSHRLIVELVSPPLSAWAKETGTGKLENGKIDFNAPALQSYLQQLETEQAAFVSAMQAALPSAFVSQYINEFGDHVDLTYQVAFNGMAVDPGSTPTAEARKVLAGLPGVKAVSLDYAHSPEMYASLPLINAPAAWSNTAIGGKDNAGAGIKFASMDGGVHHAAPMFDGAGYSYPADYPPNGLGLTANNNGKIIASRVYFRSWDPPSPGDENPWPGTQGTSHGTHTASTAAGNEVVADYLGITETISGVAPKAWVMSYRVFYNSITNDGSFYNAEGIAALEDILVDGSDVLNNSWGGGPGSVGGEFDPLDQALINVANAGTFVSMSAGNAGPGNGTTDHPSDEYINVAASSTDGTLASGRLSVTAPEPVIDTLKNMPYASASFGSSLAPGGLYPFDYLPAISVNPGNANGCAAWPADTFTGKAALIIRGSCEFGVKVLNAEQAGADFVIVYNSAAGGDTLINMGPGAVGNLVTIPSVFIWNSKGLAMVDWYTANGAASEVTLDTLAFQAGNTPDVLASFSSRGPGAGNVLKPDITAPGVNILAQGFASGVSGEDRHLGFGQASGTSMAAPHVAGAAALLRQIHPDWSNAYIKSAMMSTSKYVGIWNNDGSHAQPLDMGAGRLDLTNAADPGVILDAPSLSFGAMVTGTVETLNVMVTSVATQTETYDLSGVSLGGSWPTATLGSLPAFAVSPVSFTLGAGETAVITVTFDSTSSAIGDNQGMILLDGAMYDAHLPAWARVQPAATGKVLVIQNDGSFTLGNPDYLSYYTDTLDNLGIPYDVWNADEYFTNPTTIPEAAVLSSYDAIIYFTGDFYQNDGTFTVSTPLTNLDMDRLTEYANGGGKIFAMGQDLAGVLNSDVFDGGTFLYSSVLGGNWLQDSVTGYDLPDRPVVASTHAPQALQGVELDLSGMDWNMVQLTGFNEVPPVATANYGEAWFNYDAANMELYYDVNVVPTTPMTVTASHIHDGVAGVNGPVVFPLFSGPQYITETLNFNGSVTLNITQEVKLLNEGLYINVHSSVYPAGEIRAQVVSGVSGDGAGNQYYIDEIETMPLYEPNDPGYYYPYMALFTYPGPYNTAEGTVGMAHRQQPTLELPGISYFGRSIYTTFGLEGVNNGGSGISREDLMSAMLDWAMDEPVATIVNTTVANAGQQTFFEAGLTSNVGATPVSYRWDYGDGSVYAGPYTANQTGHTYMDCGTYTVRVEVIDSWGNHALGELETEVIGCESGANAMLQIAHLAPFAVDPGTAVTVTLDGVPVLPNFEFADSTGYLPVSAGITHTVEVFAAGVVTPAISADIYLMAGQDYTAIAVGGANSWPLELMLLMDDNTAPATGNFKLRLGHLAPFTDTITGTLADVRLEDGTPVITDVVFGAVAPYLELPAGTYNLKITTPGGAVTLINPLPVTFAAGQVLSAFAVGDGVNQPLGVFALPAGAPGFLLPLSPARLEVGHLAPFAMDPGTAVTVTLDGTPVLTDFVFAESTGYLELPPGDYDVAIWPAGSTSPAISGSVTLMEGMDYTAIAIGDGANQPLGLLALLDDNSAPAAGNFKLRLGHLAPFTDTITGTLADVRLQDGTPVITDVVFGAVAPYLELPEGTYDLKITTPGGAVTLIDPLPVTFNAGDIVSAFAVGEGVNQPLGVFAWPAGVPGFLLPLVQPVSGDVFLPLVMKGYNVP